MIHASVIIPVYNDAAELAQVLSALNKQTFNRKKFEVLVVDNGSTDNTKEVVGQHRNVIYLTEHNYLNSPYSSRNRGIERSRGELIVLLDSTCIPEKDWLETGLTCLHDTGSDLISSNVLFDFQGKVTAGKLFDSNNLQIENRIRSDGAVMTASLFIKRKVFDQVGKFPEGVRSGADLRWTRKATSQGFKLTFCKHSVARKKARTFTQSVKKQWRVGKGQPAIWKKRGEKLYLFKRVVSHLIPFHPRKLNRFIENKEVEINFYLKFKLYFTVYFIWNIMAIANIYGYYFTGNSNERVSLEADRTDRPSATP